MNTPRAPKIAIACGGTGGHLFPGIAIGEQLAGRGCRVTLLISPKEVDQHAVKAVTGMEIVTLPAIGLTRGRALAFLSGFWKSYRAAKNIFRNDPPKAALAMGGFTSAPPILAAKHLGAKAFLHESNTIPGRANRWLSRVVDQAFVGFPQAAARLHTSNVVTTGTPVRPQFQPRDARDCRRALGLDPEVATVLVMGGSQGATGINNLVINALPLAWERRRLGGENTSHTPAGSRRPQELQFFHLTGPTDVERVRRAYAENNFRAVVHPFFNEMELAFGAATIAVSRAGASSLAEIAAMRLPSILIPFPAATDNHQFFNARAFEEAGAAQLIEQKSATPESLAKLLNELASNPAAREQMQTALAKWHSPNSAEQIAEKILGAIGQPVISVQETVKDGSPSSGRQSFSVA